MNLRPAGKRPVSEREWFSVLVGCSRHGDQNGRPPGHRSTGVHSPECGRCPWLHSFLTVWTTGDSRQTQTSRADRKVPLIDLVHDTDAQHGRPSSTAYLVISTLSARRIPVRIRYLSLATRRLVSRLVRRCATLFLLGPCRFAATGQNRQLLTNKSVVRQ